MTFLPLIINRLHVCHYKEVQRSKLVAMLVNINCYEIATLSLAMTIFLKALNKPHCHLER